MSPPDRWLTDLRPAIGSAEGPMNAGATRGYSTIRKIMLVSLILIGGCARVPQSPTASTTSKPKDSQPSQADDQTESSETESTASAFEPENPVSSQTRSSTARLNQMQRDSDQASTNRDATVETDSAPRNTPDSGSKGKTKKSGDPEAARKNVAALRQKADQAKSRNDPGSAFRQTIAAWEEARRFPEDEQLRRAANELTAQMKTLSQQANDKHDAASDTHSTLVEK